MKEPHPNRHVVEAAYADIGPAEIFEAHVWALLTQFTDRRMTPDEFVAHVVQAADWYAAGDTDTVTELRRNVLATAAAARR